MLSSARLLSKQASIRHAAKMFAATKHASTWAKVPQGPPVRYAELRN